MKSFSRQIILMALIFTALFFLLPWLYAETTEKTSDKFTLDTREINPIPVDGWQDLSKQGNTYSEDILIDDHGKVWCFYYQSPGAQQPVYVKIFKPDGYQYKYKMIAGYGSASTDPNRNSIRAALNQETGDVWVALEGTNGGYFVIYDSTGNIKQDSTQLAINAHFPKVIGDKQGRMWFSYNSSNPWQAYIVGYNDDGDQLQSPVLATEHDGVINTDIAVDDSNRIWVTTDIHQGEGGFASRVSIFEDDFTQVVDGELVGEAEVEFDPQRSIYADPINHGMWILEKAKPSYGDYQLHLYRLDRTKVTTLENIGNCGFLRNEINRIEVIRFDESNSSNKRYQIAEFDPISGEQLMDWVTAFDSTHQFVKNGVAYNRNYNTLKAYVVNKEENRSRIKFLPVTPGYPVISISPTAVNFDTTKIKAGYQKQRMFAVQNTGNDLLIVSDINPLDARFSVTDTSFQLNPGGSKNVIVAFAPTDTNIVNSQIQILSNDPNNPTAQITVTGKGYQPTHPKITVSPATLVFDTIVLGSKQTQYLFIENKDVFEPLVVSNIANSDSQFYVNKSAFTVAPGRGEWVTVTFEPKIASDLIADSLRITNNDPDTSLYIVPLIAASREPDKPQIAVSPDSLDFGEVSVDESKTLNLKLSNQGEAPLEVSAIISSNAQFTVNKTELTVQSEQTEVIQVTFSPTSEGNKSGTLTILSNDEEQSELVVPVTGAGAVLSDPYLVYDQEEIFFGKVFIGDSLRKSLLLQNYGDHLLVITDVATTDERFRVSADTIRIAKQESHRLWISFIPDDTLKYSGTLQFMSNDPNNDFVEIGLSGSGGRHYQQISVFPTHVNFGEVILNAYSYKNLLITNIGTRTLTISDILTDNYHFQPGTTSFELAAEQSRQISVAFSPDSAKIFNGKLTIVSDDPVADSLIVTVTGSGRDSTTQSISVSTDSLNFGEIAKNNTRVLSFRISNLGEKKLRIFDMVNSDSAFRIQNKTLDVEGLSFATAYVTFTPDTIKSYNDTLLIYSNDPNVETQSIILTGQGRAQRPQRIELSTNYLEFGSVAIGRSKSRSLWIENSGERNLTIRRVEISDEQFTASDNWFVIKPGDSKYFVVTYTPQRQGAVSETVTFHSNDPDNPQVTIELTGRGEEYTGPEIAVSSEVLNFGATLIGVRKQLSLKIYNLSEHSALEINEYSLNHNSFTVTHVPSTVARGDSGFIRILYHPLEEGYHSANLTISSNDVFHGSFNIFISGYGVQENSGQNKLADWGWNGIGSAPFGDGFSGMVSNYTADVLSAGEQQVWFIKDVFLNDYPRANEALMNIAFKNNITLVINNTLVFDSSAVNLEYWNKTDLDVSKYLSIGRNRIAATVGTDRNRPDGGFDCELLVNEEPVIKRGDQNWNQTEALWWYFYYPGERAPVDTLYNRFWFSRDYAITGIDSVIASWVFEPNGSDTLYDSTPYGHRAILRNVTWVDGLVGKAMSFSGQNNSYAELDANLNFLPQSIQMWINCYQQKTERQNIITNKGAGDFGHGIFIADDLSLGVYYYNGEIKFPGFKVDINNWHYLSTQYNFDRQQSKNVVTLFVDGVQVGSHEYDIAYASSGGNKCYIAANPTGEQIGAFEGAIDELIILNTVSGAAPQLEIAAIDLWGDDHFIHADSANVKFSVYPSPFKIISGVFSYAHGGSDEFNEDTNFYDPNSIYNSPLQIDLPVDYADIRGVKFSLELQTNYGDVRYPQAGVGEFDYDFLRFGTENESSNLALRERIYRMISVPYELEQPDILSVLEDEFGAYDKYRWRLFDWNQADSAYIEFQDSSWTDDLKFERGKSFWLVTDRLESFDANHGITPEYQDFPIHLKPGWNMIANPFPYPVRWQDVQKDEPGLISDLNYYSAIDLVGWEKSILTRQMEPWKGYFVFNSDENYRTIIVPASATTDIALPRTLSLEDQYRSKYPDVKMLISAEVRCGQYFDGNNLYGVANRARAGFDSYDQLEMPAIGEYVSMWVNRLDRQEKAGAFTIDFQKTGENGYSWDIVIEHAIDEPAEMMQLNFENIIPIPEAWLLYLFDLDNDVAYNLKQNTLLSISTDKQKSARRIFKLVIGTEDYLKNHGDDIPLAPMAFELMQNYPNPFNASTTIQFSLPKRMHTKVQIFNIAGQLVRTLVNKEMRGGINKIIWDGRNDHGQLLTTGLYIIRTETAQQSAVKKMLLIK